MSKSRRRKPLPQGTFQATITGLSHEGRGIAHIDGKTTFLFGGLPGETVEFSYTRQRGAFDEGDVTAVLKRSEQRSDELCQHFGLCGGCSLQHLQHKAQIDIKQQSLAEQLTHQTNITPNTWLAPLVASPWQYRRKARLSVRHVPKKNKVLVGFRERNGRFVADLQRCPVLAQHVGEHIQALSELLFHFEHKDAIPQIEIAMGDEDIAIIIRHLQNFSDTELAQLTDFVRTRQWRLYLQPKGIDSVQLHYPTEDTNPLLHYQLHQYSLTLYFHPSQFIQVNSSLNQQMVDQAIELLDLQPSDSVLDLFCGIGNFSLPIATRTKHVVGVEADNSAVLQAQKNADYNKLTNTEFYAADLFETDYSPQAPWVRHYDKLLLDPPRSGAAAMIAQLPRFQVSRIVYVSCNPATLARDTQALLAQGYQLEAAGMIDMFPHTQHTEAMTLFTRAT